MNGPPRRILYVVINSFRKFVKFSILEILRMVSIASPSNITHTFVCDKYLSVFFFNTFTHFITHFTDLLFVLISRLPRQSFAEYPCREYLGIAARVSSKMRTLFDRPWRRIPLSPRAKHLIRPSFLALLKPFV